VNHENDYTKHYKEFSRNVDFAARTWHRYVHLNARASEDKEILEALNKAAAFWVDFNYSSFQTTIIFLGKIFTHEPFAYSIDKTLNAASANEAHFSKSELRKRKPEFDGIDEYIENSTELTAAHVKSIKRKAREAKDIWGKIKPLRNKVYAHSDILSDEEKQALFQAVNRDDINKIIQILLNISHALWQAEFNGREPDFSCDHEAPINHAKKSVEELITSLLPEKTPR